LKAIATALIKNAKLDPNCLNYIFVRKIKTATIAAFTIDPTNISILQDMQIDNFTGKAEDKKVVSINDIVHEGGHQFTLGHFPDEFNKILEKLLDTEFDTIDDLKKELKRLSSNLMFPKNDTPFKVEEPKIEMHIIRGEALEPSQRKKIREIAETPKKFKLNPEKK